MPAAHAHSRTSDAAPEPTAGRRGWLITTIVVAVAVAAIGAAALTLRGPGGAAASPASPTSTAAAAVEVAAGPLRVVSVTPAAGAQQVPSDATVSVQLSAPIGPHSPTPTLAPAVPGAWQVVSPDTFAFVPAGPLPPAASMTVTVPGGSAGVVNTAGKPLAQTVTVPFTVAAGSTLRLQQLLGQLGYLPLTFVPAAPLTSPQEAAQPQEGTFSWRWSEPASLMSLWSAGTANQITTGAVMAFESHHAMTTDGIAGPLVWQQLLTDAASGAMDPNPYTYVYVSQTLPETTTVYRDGAPVYSTAANTGVAGAPTAPGTFPVYLRYTVTTMSGTNPDGSKYVDPGIPWVSYFNGGDALHGFDRASYGFPQSDGCVEMPPANAAVVYPLTPIGTLVTVS